MKTSVILHHYWNEPGGGELVCSSVALAFKSIGYEPVLASPMKIDVSKYPKWYGINLEGMKTYSYPMDLKAFGIYLRLLVGGVGKRAVKKHMAEVLFTDESGARKAMKELKRKGVKTIEYIHFPLEMSIEDKYRGTGYFYGEDPYILERYSKFPMNIYWQVYKSILPFFISINPFEASDIVLTNSSWTAERAKEVYGEKPKVLNPPIPPSTEIVKEPRPFEERERAIVMLGRYSEEKRYHWVIEKVFPKVLKEYPEAKLYIMGSSGIRSTKNYYNRVEGLAEELKLKIAKRAEGNGNLYLLTNVSEDVKKRIMDSSRVFLHATINEHWGVAVSEAMARGLPVSLHRSGGAWSDLAEYGKNAVGYENEEEAAEAILKLMNDEREWKKYSEQSLKRVRELDLQNFIRKFRELLEKD